MVSWDTGCGRNRPEKWLSSEKERLEHWRETVMGGRVKSWIGTAGGEIRPNGGEEDSEERTSESHDQRSSTVKSTRVRQ